MVYMDDARHLVADSLKELHAFAEKCEIKRCWFDADRAGGKPHYDIPQYILRECSLLLSIEATLVSSREVLKMSKALGRSRGRKN